MFLLCSMFFFAILIYVLFKLKTKYSYWNKKGVKGPTPMPFIGNCASVFCMKQTFPDLMKSVYAEYTDEKIVGIYSGVTPILLVRDVELLKHILIKDFSSFQNRGFKPRRSRVSKNLFEVEGNTWKVLRHKLSPIFTTMKLKEMMPLLIQSSNNFINHVNFLLDNNIDHELRSLCAKFTLDVIGSTAFGIDVNAYSDDSIFRKMSNQIAPRTSVFQQALILIDMIVPGFRKLCSFADSDDLFVFMKNLIPSIIKEREGQPKVRHDFMDLLIKLKEEGRASRRDNEGLKEIEIDDEIIEAQALLFYGAGYEGNTSLFSFLLYELAINEDIQQKLYQEICDVSNKYSNKITLESISELSYLQMVINETCRKRTINQSVLREAVSDYKIPDSDIVIDKGTCIFVSIEALHHDPKHFERPDKFNPENFSSENLKNIPQCAFMPFGLGPRNCIAKRFAETVAKVGMFMFLKEFKVEPSSKTKEKLKYDVRFFTPKTKEGLWIKISKQNLKNIPQCAFMPFGLGPRNCIAKRFAETVAKVGMFIFLREFKVEPSSKTKEKLKYDVRFFTPKTKEGLWIKISKR